MVRKYLGVLLFVCVVVIGAAAVLYLARKEHEPDKGEPVKTEKAKPEKGRNAHLKSAPAKTMGLAEAVKKTIETQGRTEEEREARKRWLEDLVAKAYESFKNDPDAPAIKVELDKIINGGKPDMEKIEPAIKRLERKDRETSPGTAAAP